MAPAGSDSENEEEAEGVERNGEEVDPAINQTEHEEEEEDDDDDDEDDDEVPEPKGTTSAQLGGSKPPTPAAAPVAPAVPKPTKPPTKPPTKAQAQGKLPVMPANKLSTKPIAKPTTKPAATATGSEADDDEGEEQMTFSIAQRQLPTFTAYDAAADAESMRKRQTDTASTITGTHVESYINPELANEDIIHKDLRVNKYAVGPAAQRGHQRGNEPFKITHAAFTAKNPRAKPAGWTERLIDRDGSNVLANLCIARVSWPGDAEGDISVIGSVKVELYKDDAIQEKQYNDFTRKMPPTDKAGIYMQFDERQMRRLYDITDCGLPTEFHPNNPNVHYRVIVKMEDYATAESGWTLYVAPPKQRPSGSGVRKAAADKAEGGGGGAAKKQKTTVQTHLTGAPPPPAADASMSSAIVVLQEPPSQSTAPENGATNGVEDYSDGGAPAPAQPQQPQQPQSHALVPMAQPVAMNGTVAVQPLALKLPLVNWTNNGGGALTAMLPDAYTYALHTGPGGTLLIANLAPTH